MKLFAFLKRLSKKKKIIFGLVFFIILISIGFVVWGIITGWFSSLAATPPIDNTATITYEDKDGHVYGVQSNTSLVDVLGSSEGGTTDTANTTDTTDTTQTPTTTPQTNDDISAVTSSSENQTSDSASNSSESQPASVITQSLNNFNQAYEGSTLKPWAFWFLFGFIPLFLVVSGIYYFFRLRHK